MDLHSYVQLSFKPALGQVKIMSCFFRFVPKEMACPLDFSSLRFDWTTLLEEIVIWSAHILVVSNLLDPVYLKQIHAGVDSWGHWFLFDGKAQLFWAWISTTKLWGNWSIVNGFFWASWTSFRRPVWDRCQRVGRILVPGRNVAKNGERLEEKEIWLSGYALLTRSMYALYLVVVKALCMYLYLCKRLFKLIM